MCCRRNELVALDLFLTAVATVFAFVSMVVSRLPAGESFLVPPFVGAVDEKVSATMSDYLMQGGLFGMNSPLPLWFQESMVRLFMSLCTKIANRFL